MLTSVTAGAVVPLTQLQSELYSFLFGIAGVQAVVAELEGVAGAGLSPAADALVASQWRLVLSLAGIPGGPWAGNAAGVATLGGLAASIFGATQSFFRSADCDLLPPGSLAAFQGAAGRAHQLDVPLRRNVECLTFLGVGDRLEHGGLGDDQPVTGSDPDQRIMRS